MREYEIGSEAWLRERLERGLDPGEGDLQQDDRLRIEVEFFGLPARPAEASSASSTSSART